MYTTHSAVQLCTDCGNLSPSVSERSSLLSGARFARARVRRAANVRVYTPINVHHGCVHTPHSNPCASWSGWLALFPTIMRVLCARVCTKVDTRETEKRLLSNDAHDTEFNNPPSKHAYRDFVLRNCFSFLLWTPFSFEENADFARSHDPTFAHVSWGDIGDRWTLDFQGFLDSQVCKDRKLR